MLALGIDCATRSGWAAVESHLGRESLIEHGIVDAAAETPLWEQMDSVLDKARHVALVAIELPWLGDNPHTLEVLARLCGQWEHACAMRGLDCVLVRPQQWGTSILSGLITTHSKRAQRKRAAKMWCKATFGVDLPEDEADAACLSTWAIRQAQAKRLGLPSALG